MYFLNSTSEQKQIGISTLSTFYTGMLKVIQLILILLIISYIAMTINCLSYWILKIYLKPLFKALSRLMFFTLPITYLV